MVNLEPCDVIFVRKRKRPSLFAWLVCWITKSPYSHVAYYVDGTLLFEANANRSAGFADLSDLTEYDVKRLKLPLETRRAILNRIIATEGAGYGWGEIAALFLRLKFGINVFYDDRQRYICSEEIVRATYEETGLRIVDQITFDVSPADLWRSDYLTEV
ncbi:hypothetical protein [Paenibacillus planticolens]|uniref:Permuted papain-like amidase YaeF/Yiix C92 family enzyme n=1 Tax=Paenibacillus planticolens TaxID=2654976 RepID=A0ABX1ZF50_9BACL|nr:hypothetical protein [Paenibacillus planticolens]NOU98495.1 hypothetical protein [Paenibacillus planticolens]